MTPELTQILMLFFPHIVLATGCRERTRGNISIPGSRPAGVFTAGVAQNLVNVRNVMIGKRVVILGSGDIGLIMARRLTLEGAKVLAIADVYDALVSKRVYKESFSFEKANAIILEGMGSQFDPELRRFYEAARPKLEAYYSRDM